MDKRGHILGLMLVFSSSMIGPLLFAGSAPVIQSDNSELNKEATKNRSATAEDQSNEANALERTRRIRDAITDDKALSTNAHNIKIITQGSTVILKGPVRSQQEKRRVEEIVAKAAGQFTVKSELTVTAD